jgi:hypothetical protein
MCSFVVCTKSGEVVVGERRGSIVASASGKRGSKGEGEKGREMEGNGRKWKGSIVVVAFGRKVFTYVHMEI